MKKYLTRFFVLIVMSFWACQNEPADETTSDDSNVVSDPENLVIINFIDEIVSVGGPLHSFYFITDETGALVGNYVELTEIGTQLVIERPEGFTDERFDLHYLRTANTPDDQGNIGSDYRMTSYRQILPTTINLQNANIQSANHCGTTTESAFINLIEVPVNDEYHGHSGLCYSGSDNQTLEPGTLEAGFRSQNDNDDYYLYLKNGSVGHYLTIQDLSLNATYDITLEDFSSDMTYVAPNYNPEPDLIQVFEVDDANRDYRKAMRFETIGPDLDNLYYHVPADPNKLYESLAVYGVHEIYWNGESRIFHRGDQIPDISMMNVAVTISNEQDPNQSMVTTTGTGGDFLLVRHDANRWDFGGGAPSHVYIHQTYSDGDRIAYHFPEIPPDLLNQFPDLIVESFFTGDANFITVVIEDFESISSYDAYVGEVFVTDGVNNIRTNFSNYKRYNEFIGWD